MTAETQIEDTLDRDFFFFISSMKTYYQQVVEKKDKELCKQWLDKLCGERVEGTSQKRSRNIILSQLITNMREKKLSGPFQNPPTDGPLPSASAIFGLADLDEISVPEEDDNVGDILEDFEERSADGRTYVAIRCLPDSQGTYAFVALNIDKDESKDKTAEQSRSRHKRALSKAQNGTITLGGPSVSPIEGDYGQNLETKISDDISKLREEILPPEEHPGCRHKNEMAFTDILLKQIDEEIKGVVSGDNKIVKFFINRLAEDWKKVPQMEHIFKLKPEQQRLKLLQMLRQKLIVREQEEKHRNILADMKERITASATKSECCMGEDEEPAESMWKLMITRPLTDADIGRLYDTYPEEVISIFLDLLAEDRGIILKRGKKRQHKLLESMRSEVYKEVQAGKAEYNKARATYREWNDILSTVEEVMYEAGVEEGAMCTKKEPAPQKKEELLTSMIMSIKETENIIKEEARRGEALSKEITAANEWTYTPQEDRDEEIWEIKAMIENIKEQNELYNDLIKKQEIRITQLRQKLDYN